eukprot:1461005-Pyramimonas_sp.AAC.1
MTAGSGSLSILLSSSTATGLQSALREGLPSCPSDLHVESSGAMRAPRERDFRRVRSVGPGCGPPCGARRGGLAILGAAVA